MQILHVETCLESRQRKCKPCMWRLVWNQDTGERRVPVPGKQHKLWCGHVPPLPASPCGLLLVGVQAVCLSVSAQRLPSFKCQFGTTLKRRRATPAWPVGNPGSPNLSGTSPYLIAASHATAAVGLCHIASGPPTHPQRPLPSQEPSKTRLRNKLLSFNLQGRGCAQLPAVPLQPGPATAEPALHLRRGCAWGGG